MFIKGNKVKINISNTSFKLNLVALSILMTIITIFFSIDIGSVKDDGNMSSIIKIRTALVVRKTILWSEYIASICVLLIFLLSSILGRTRFEYGMLYGIIWIIIFLFLCILPFLLHSNNTFNLVKRILIIIPTILIYIGQFSFLNDLSWTRRANVEKSRRMKWL